MTTIHEWAAVAERSYNAYATVTGWKNYQGQPMPAWGALPDIIKSAWIAAVMEVARPPKKED